MSELSKKMCSLGWFYFNSLEITESIKIKSLIDEGNLSEIDSFFLHHFESNLANFKKLLLKQNGNRKAIIEEIFKGIEYELYYLVMPAIIGQIDGITDEKTSKRFFTVINRKKNNVSQLETHLNEYVESKKIWYFTEPLTHPVNSIWEFSKVQDVDNPSQINRHDIIHGASIDYGNKLGCFKYLSVLLFVSDNLDNINLQI